MNNGPLIDESLLNGIPDDLIRPLLAISIRATELHTIEDFEHLFKDIEKISRRCSEAGGQSLYYVRVRGDAMRRLSAARHAEAWAQRADPTAQFGGIHISRWRIHTHGDKGRRRLFVSYKLAGLDPDTMEEKSEVVISEADENEL